MNSLFGLLAAPSVATTAFDVAGRTADAASAPFELLMEMAMQDADSSAGVEALSQEEDEAESLEQRVAEQLQSLLESLGVQSDDRMTIEVDNATGDLSVVGDHPLAAEIESALHDDVRLEANIRRLAARDGLFGAAPFAANSRLEVELAEEQGAAQLTWH